MAIAQRECDIKYDLPKAVVSVRDGWQWTCQSGAVVSGLLAAVAAQLLVFFKASDSYSARHAHQGAIDFLVASCYAALFLNIGATIISFILIDNLGEVGYRASCKPKAWHTAMENAGVQFLTQTDLLVEFGATRIWSRMLIYWLLMFYTGILALIISTLTYVFIEETLATQIAMSFIVAVILLPSSYLIFLQPLNETEAPATTQEKQAVTQENQPNAQGNLNPPNAQEDPTNINLRNNPSKNRPNNLSGNPSDNV